MDDQTHAVPRLGFFAALNRTHIVNAFIAFIFAISGPVVIMFAVSAKGQLSSTELASWIFGAFFLNGAVSFAACYFYRQPLVFLWSIPGVVLVGTAIEHLAFSDIVGAYLASGVVLLLLGVSRWQAKMMDMLPMPIVMGMVAGVLLQFGLGWVQALYSAPAIAVPMTVAYFAVAAWPLLSRAIPPMFVTLVVGAGAIYATGTAPAAPDLALTMAQPVLFIPTFSWAAMIELVIPLVITVIFVQNGQGIAILRNAAHQPPINAITTICGVASLFTALVGIVSTCLTGPVNGIISASADNRGHFAAGILVASLCMVFGLMAPVVTALLLSTPEAFIFTLGGIALLPVLQGAFVGAFAGRYPFGALVAFMVTLSEVSFLNIGAPFWGLLAGLVVSRTLDSNQA